MSRALLLGLIVGAAFGAAEMTIRMLGEQDPSVLRRSLELVGYACSWYALAGGLAFLVVAAILRFARRRPNVESSGRFRARPVALFSICLLAVSFLGASLRDSPGRLPLAPLAPPADAPNLLVILVDTLRADALGCYGAPTPTPAIDGLAARGALFNQVLAPASWTFPSVASLLTSTHPWQHGCVDFDRAVSPELASLPQVLSAHGYECIGVLGNPLLEPRLGLARGFHIYDAYGHEVEGSLFFTRLFSKTLRVARLLSYKSRRPVLAFDPRFPFVTTRLTNYALDEDVNARLFEYVEFPGERPRFLYVHFVAPHTPYLEHPYRFLKTQLPLAADKLPELRARYAGEVTYTDSVIADLLEHLGRTGFLENGYVVVTADHGEEFMEHDGFEHGYGLYQEVVKIPLLIAGPGITPGTRIEEPVQLLDVAPTLLDYARIERPASFVGRSLRPLLQGEAGAGPPPAYLEISSRFLTPDTSDDQRPQRARSHFGVATERWKVIHRLNARGELEREEIYDLASDPLERAPLAGPPAEVQALLEDLDLYEKLTRAGEATELSPEELERLKALGYLGEARD